MASCKTYDPHQKSKENMLRELRNLFGKLVPGDIIRTVATEFDYDFEKSSHWLLEMTNQIARDDLRAPTTPNNKKTKPKAPPQQRPTSIKQSQSTNAIATTPNTNNRSKKSLEVERVCNKIKKGYKVLVILRGLPGSGKSRLATVITDVTLGPGNNQHHVLSADDFFVQPRVGYVFDPNRVQEAHNFNQRRAFETMSRGVSPVIIDNTNTRIWEMKAYGTMAVDFGYYVEILEPDTWWSFNEKELTKRNIHGVPKPKIKEMLERYEKNITPQKLLSAYKLEYKHRIPPQMRLIPPVPEPSHDEIIQDLSCSGTSVVKSKSTSALSRQMSISSNSTEEGELINLMDFTDDNQLINHNHNNPWNCANNSVDAILMCPMDDKSDNILQPSSTSPTKTNLFADIENAWGVDAKALQSWDIVTPLEYDSNNSTRSHNLELTQRESKEFTDGYSNVDIEDFRFLSKPFDGTGREFKVIVARGRDINQGLSPRQDTVPRKILIDKSSFTEEDVDVSADETTHLKSLADLFPKLPKSYLKELYCKCGKNFNWTVDVLLDDNSHDLIDNLSRDDEVEEVDVEKPEEEVMMVNEVEQPLKRRISPDEALELKKCLESKIDINKEHYSDHVYKVKQWRFGVNADQPQASTSTSQGVQYVSSSDDDSDDIESNPKQIVEINLGDALVSQLKTLFGVDNFTLPDDFQPVVQMPMDTARQIFTLYAESVCQQMENQSYILDRLVKEDEEFARKLQTQEEARVQPPQRPPNLDEIMDEQKALSLHQKEIDEWKTMTADNLALRMTRQKLFNSFPSVPQDSLIEILHAYGNDYNKTVEDLVASVGAECVNTEFAKEPPLNRDVIDEMKAAEEYCNATVVQTQGSGSFSVDSNFYREEANKHLQKRQQLFDRAQSYYKKGMTEVAMFYSELARKETGKYDRANNLAAAALAEEHSKRLQKFDTLDLHYLYVKEAIASLDIFIDRNIYLMAGGSGRRSQDLFVITGRGKNSAGGVSKIQPAVKSRLKKRNIRYAQLNPGLLKIVVTGDCLVTNDLP